MKSLVNKPVHIGFTGTQEGMTYPQAEALVAFLGNGIPFVAHHGDCIGADAQFDAIARACLFFEWMEIHPCHLTDKRANCTIGPRDVLHPTCGPLQRNEHIVAASELLIATPKEDHMQLRSGTWTTVRYAVKAGKKIVVLLPDGSVVPW